MSEWWTYSLSDFLLFSRRTYYRLFELYNVDIWPLQSVALALGCVILALFWRPRAGQGRFIAAILALCWIWVAWAFHWRHFVTINWAATYVAYAFGCEALLLIVFGVVRDDLAFAPGSVRHRIGFALVIFAVFVEPLIAPLVGRGFSNAEIGTRLYVSPATAKAHVSHVMTKLSARDRAQLVVVAYESGLVRPGE